VKKYLGHSYFPLHTRFMTRQPSEWIRPRRSCRGYRSTISCCQSTRRIDR
jgi:hypothetical protein